MSYVEGVQLYCKLCILLLGVNRHMLPSWYTASFVKRMCFNRIQDGCEKLSENRGFNSTQYTLDGHPGVQQKRATQVFLLANTKSQTTPISAYNTRIFPYVRRCLILWCLFCLLYHMKHTTCCWHCLHLTRPSSLRC